MADLTILASLALGMSGLGIYEQITHRRRLHRIPLRIHVNGTRGKSSVTRLIAAGLREAGLRAIAKTTGTLPRFILANGREIPIYRPSRANILEQIRTVAAAAAHRAEALVVECMALQPQLQWLSEWKMVRATHGVITNARPDHLDVMGPTDEDVAWALAGMIPCNGKLFTAEQEHLNILNAAAKDRGTEVIAINRDHVAAINDDMMAGFDYHEHAENVALALAVCEDAGISREVALAGMHASEPDPGAMTEYHMDFFGRSIYFVNGFAANDPVSTERLWRDALSRHHQVDKTIALFNCRSDRSDRSVSLGAAIAKWPRADHLLLIGDGTYVFAKTAVEHSMSTEEIVFVESERIDEIFETIVSMIQTSALIVGMGNIGGPGLPLVSYFASRSRRL